MAAYTPGADTDSTFRTSVERQPTIISEHSFNGTLYKILGDVVTTVVEFRGLSRAEALAMGESADYNYRDVHGVTFSNGTGAFAITMSYPSCEGVECKAAPRRINNADMFRVVVTHVATTASFSHDGFTKTTF